eukprot:c24737_g8_i1 orf=89-298(+)
MPGTIHVLWSLQLVKKGPEEEEWPCRKEKHRRSNDSLWKDYFRDPSKWWDNRSSKLGPAYPDFKHKTSK